MAGVIAGLALGTLAALSLTDLLVVRDGQVSGARHTAREAALEAAGLAGTRTFRASAADARARLRSLPTVLDARVEVDLGGTYRVTLTEREAAGRWIADGVEYFVDREGVLFRSADPAGAPALRVRDGSGARSAGERLDPALVTAALRLAALAPGELRGDMRAPSVRVDPGPALVLASGGRWELRFGSPDRFDEKLTVARQFFRDEPARPLDYVDVRSPDRVVFSPR